MVVSVTTRSVSDNSCTENQNTHSLCAWRKVNGGEIHNLFDLPDTTGVIHFGKIRWAGHVARLEEKRNAYSVLVT